MTELSSDKLSGFNGTLPLSQASTIPNTWYSDPEIAAAEKQKVFATSWHLVGPAEKVSQPGEFMTGNLAGNPVIVLRDREGTLRAVSNVCRHKAARVELRPWGKTQSLHCRYHGWTYDLTGKLRAAPEFEGVENFPGKSCQLPEFQVAIFGPMVFVNQSKTAESLASGVFDAFTSRHKDLDLSSYRFAGRKEYQLKCNWKVFNDNYLDGGYHIRTIHPGLYSVVNYPKYTIELFRQSSLQLSPLKAAEPENAGVGNVRKGQAAYYWWMFPNLMINIYEGTFDTNVVLPTGPDSCSVGFDYYYDPKVISDPAAFMERSIAVADQVQDEDMGICEDVQRGLASDHYTTGRFSVGREAGEYQFHRLLAEKLRGDGRA